MCWRETIGQTRCRDKLRKGVDERQFRKARNSFYFLIAVSRLTPDCPKFQVWNESLFGRILFQSVSLKLPVHIVSISPEYHRRQAATLAQLAQTTRDPDTAKALLRMAAEHIARAEEAVRTITLVAARV
jgi:hypothetical protein